MKRYFFLLIFFILISCSDSSIELGNNYFLKVEGKFSNEIINRKPNKSGIPSDIIRFNFDDNYIIVEQKPNAYDDVMNDNVYKYNEGRDKLYYWIIIKETDVIIGPLSNVEYENQKNIYKISSNLNFKTIY